MRSVVLILLAALGMTSCRLAPPALEVAGVNYSEADLRGLTPQRREALAEITAFGHAVATGTVEELGEPLLAARRDRRLGELLRAWMALDSLEVGEDALRAHYVGDPEVELTVRHLVVLSPRHEPEAARAEARQKAEEALARVRAGEPFPEVAAEVSEEPGAGERQGLLAPGREGTWVREFWAAARSLEVGGVSPVVETQYGFHVLRLEGLEVVPFEETRERVVLEVGAMMGVRESDGPPVPGPTDLGMPPEDSLRHLVLDPSVPEDQPALLWEGGSLSVETLRDRLAALDGPTWDAALDPARAPALAEALEHVVRWRVAALAAERRGLAADEAWAAGVVREWTDAAAVWAEHLGFREGMHVGDLRVLSLRALGATGQNATLARLEIARRGPLIRRRYEIPTLSQEATR